MVADELASLSLWSLFRASSSASVSKRSFSRRTSRPRLWQYQKTKSRTNYDKG